MSITEQKIDREADSSRRMIFIVVGVLAAMLVAAFIWAWFYLANRPGGEDGQPRLEGAARAGSPDFDQYRSRIVVDSVEATEATRAIGDIVMELQGTVRNFTGRTIKGLELRGVVVDPQGNPIRERTVIAIPLQQSELGNNDYMKASIRIEGFSKADVRANIRMEVVGVKFE